MPSINIPHCGRVELDDIDPNADLDTLISSLSALNNTLVLALPQPLTRSFLPIVLVLVKIVGNSSEQVALLASQALTYAFDICPESTETAVEAGVVKALSTRLLSVTDMDLAEQVRIVI